MNPRQNEPPKGGENGRSHNPTCKLSSFFVNANNYPHSHKLCSASTIIHLFPPLLNTESLRPHGNIFPELRISLFNALNSNMNTISEITLNLCHIPVLIIPKRLVFSRRKVGVQFCVNSSLNGGLVTSN